MSAARAGPAAAAPRSAPRPAAALAGAAGGRAGGRRWAGAASKKRVRDKTARAPRR
jgi:hypothetical protein